MASGAAASFALSLRGSAQAGSDDVRLQEPPTAWGPERAAGGDSLTDVVKPILAALDLDGNGTVREKEHLIEALGYVQLVKEAMRWRWMRAKVDSVDAKGGKVYPEATSTRAELQLGVHLLGELMQAYGPLVEVFDKDKDGELSAEEFRRAAESYRKLKVRGRWALRAVLALIVILCCVFGLCVLAAKLTLEMHSGERGVMLTRRGEIVRTGSADFEVTPDGSLVPHSCAVGRGCPSPSPESGAAEQLPAAAGAGAGTTSAVKTSAYEVSQPLSSTLPDAAFQQLKSLTLRTTTGSMLKITVTGFKRLSLRSSLCGSVVHLLTDHGQLTLDDKRVTADAQMEEFITSAGMGGILGGGGPSVFGRRLSEDSSALDGFFNALPRADWKCESAPLPPPYELPQYYHAKVQRKSKFPSPAAAASRLFTGPDGGRLLLAGAQEEADGFYQVWSHEMVQGADVVAYTDSYAMSPFVRSLVMVRGEAKLTMQVAGGVGYGCTVTRGGAPPGWGAPGDANVPGLEFLGVSVEGGVVLRGWRLIFDYNNTSVDTNTSALFESGMVPNVQEYWDVDTDASGVLHPGEPYRLRAYSTVPGSTVFREDRYLSLENLPMALNLHGMLEFLNVTALGTSCADSSNTSDGRHLVEDLAHVRVLGKAQALELSPWVEMEDTILGIIDKFNETAHADPRDPQLRSATASPYWSAVLGQPSNTEVLQDIRTRRTLAFSPDVVAPNGTGTGRRLWSGSNKNMRWVVNLFTMSVEIPNVLLVEYDSSTQTLHVAATGPGMPVPTFPFITLSASGELWYQKTGYGRGSVTGTATICPPSMCKWINVPISLSFSASKGGVLDVKGQVSGSLLGFGWMAAANANFALGSRRVKLTAEAHVWYPCWFGCAPIEGTWDLGSFSV